MKRIKFARFGGLSPVIQKGYTTDEKTRGYHTPPARKGFYAFIWPYYDFFLLGGPFSNVDSKYPKFEYLKDIKGNKIKYSVGVGDMMKPNPELKKYALQGKWGQFLKACDCDDISDKIWSHDGYAVIRKSPKIFTHTGELWHHLKNKAVKPGDIINEVGDWIKTDYDTFVKAFHYDKIDSLCRQKHNIGRVQIEINPKSPYKNISKEHLEVFIERVK